MITLPFHHNYVSLVWVASVRCRFSQLSSVLDPCRPPKLDKDKASILTDAAGVLTQLKAEAQELKESNEKLKETIKDLKV